MQKAKFILSKGKVLEQYNEVKLASDIVSYSSKTNPDVTKILEKETDCLFSIHTQGELNNIEDKSRVLFLAQAWDQETINDLIIQGIRYFVVDNEFDLDELISFLKKNKVQINLLLRVKLKENTIRTEKYFVFGMNSNIVNKRLRQLKDNKNMLKLGIHFHRKTQNMSEWNLKYEISNILEKDILNQIDIINIGGGIPSTYANTNEDVIRTVFGKINEFRLWLNEMQIKMIIEPGRFIAAPSCKLITYIKSIYENNIIVNASVYNTDMDALIVPVKLLVKGELSKDQSMCMVPVRPVSTKYIVKGSGLSKQEHNTWKVRTNHAHKSQGKPYVIKGLTPCSMDLFRYRVYLNNPLVGEQIIFLNAGAYNFSSDFCELERLETEVID